MVYAVSAGIWIVASDLVLAFVSGDFSTIVWASIAKGALFVTVTAALLYWVIVRTLAQEPVDTADPAIPSEARGWWRGPAGLVVVMGALLVAGLVGLQWLHARITLESAHEGVAAIAELKARKLELWLRFQVDIATSFRTAPFVHSAMAALRRGGDPRVAGALSERLEELRESLGAGVLGVVDAAGNPLAAAGAPLQVSPWLRTELEHAIATGVPRRMLLHPADPAGGGQHLDFIIPLAPGSSGSAASHALLVRHDASALVLPLVESWPEQRRTAESLLVRREGEDIVFLTTLRHGGAPQALTRAPLWPANFAAARIVRDGERKLRGVDYRGTEVLAYGRPLEGSDWALVAKVDVAEVLEDVRRATLGAAALILGLTVLAGFGATLLWRQQAGLAALRQRALQAERDALGQHLAMLSRHANDTILLVDDTGTICNANERAYEAYGYPAGSLVGASASALRPPGEGGVFDAQFQRVLRDGSAIYEVEHLRKDGSRFPVEISARVIDVGSGRYVQAIIRDISERKNAEKALRESEERFRVLLEQSIAAIFMVQDGIIVYANPRMRQIFGYGGDEAFDPDPLVHIAPGDRRRAAENMQRRLRGEAIEPYAIAGVRRDGSAFTLGLHASLATYRGKPAIIAVAQDITEKARLEADRAERLARMQSQLEAFTAVALSPHLIAGEVEAFARQVTEAVARVTGVERANAWLFNEEESELHCIDLYEATPARHSAGAVLRQEQFQNEFKALKNARYVDASEPLTDPRTAGYAGGYLKPLGITSMLDAVVQISGRHLGLLCLEHVGRPHRWQADEIAFACQMADQMALCVVNRERLQAQESLRASRDLLGTVVESVPLRVFWKDADGRFLGVNTAVARDAGLPGPQELVGRTDYDMPWREQAPRYQADDRQVMASGEPKLGIEEPQTTPDGRLIWLRTSKVPLRDPRGRSIGLLGVYEDITEQKEAAQALARANRALRTLSAGNETLVRAADERELLAEMCRVIVEVGGYRVALVARAGGNGAPARLQASHGIEKADLARLEAAWAAPEGGRTTVGNTIRTGEMQLARNIESDPAFDVQRGLMRKLGLASIIGLPLRPAADQMDRGVLSIGSGYPDAFDDGEIKLLLELANDLSFGIDALRGRIEQRDSAARLRRSLEDSIQAIAATVEARDPYTAGHEARVAELAAAIGGEMALDAATVEGIHFGALIHDLGKIRVPAEILSKPTRLTTVEYELIKAHPQSGYDILKGIDFPWPVAQMVLQHHERLDGSGYPQGMRGDAILLEARVLAVADTVEAMASHRPYRPGMGIEKALAEVESKRGVLYDAQAVDACLRLFREKGYQLPK